MNASAPLSLRPVCLPGEFVFVGGAPLSRFDDSEVLASVVEPEGRSLVVRREVADREQLSYDFIAGWITLEQPTSLDLLGITAAVSAALAARGIACNMIAGLHHDHLLVPHDRVDDALDELANLH